MSKKERKKVLLIDDSKAHLVVAKTMLVDKYEVISANSGNKALELFEEGLLPDVILLDILMPDMNGWEIYKNIKAISELNNVPIAFLTSQHGAEERINAMDLGADDYIMKPFHKEDLLKRIASLIAKETTKNQKSLEIT